MGTRNVSRECWMISRKQQKKVQFIVQQFFVMKIYSNHELKTNSKGFITEGYHVSGLATHKYSYNGTVRSQWHMNSREIAQRGKKCSI